MTDRYLVVKVLIWKLGGLHSGFFVRPTKYTMSTATPAKHWIQLRESDQHTGVTITPSNEDRFALTMEVAIRGCKLAGQIDKFNRQFDQLLHKLYDWTLAHGDDIRQVYVGFRDDGLFFLVVQQGKRFNQKLEDDLTKLDMEVAQDLDFDLIKLSVLALPNCSEETIWSFLPANGSMTYEHAKRVVPPANG